MTPMRPYLIRAVREWILANSMTPQVLVDTTLSGVRVPPGHVVKDRIILNISDGAVEALSLGDREIEFNARFGGAPFHVYLPVMSVLAVAARENGLGMEFVAEPYSDIPPDDPEDSPPAGKSGKGSARPALRVVK